jgi:hypothetical protein
MFMLTRENAVFSRHWSSYAVFKLFDDSYRRGASGHAMVQLCLCFAFCMRVSGIRRRAPRGNAVFLVASLPSLKTLAGTLLLSTSAP